MEVHQNKTEWNGLPRASGNRTEVLEYARRSRTLRNQKSAYNVVREEGASLQSSTSSRVVPQEFRLLSQQFAGIAGIGVYFFREEGNEEEKVLARLRQKKISRSTESNKRIRILLFRKGKTK